MTPLSHYHCHCHHILWFVALSVCKTGTLKGLTVTSDLTRPSSRRRKSKSRCKTCRMVDCSCSVRWLKSREGSTCSPSIPDWETKPQSLNRRHPIIYWLNLNMRISLKKNHLYLQWFWETVLNDLKRSKIIKYTRLKKTINQNNCYSSRETKNICLCLCSHLSDRKDHSVFLYKAQWWVL